MSISNCVIDDLKRETALAMNERLKLKRKPKLFLLNAMLALKMGANSNCCIVFLSLSLSLSFFCYATNKVNWRTAKGPYKRV